MRDRVSYRKLQSEIQRPSQTPRAWDGRKKRHPEARRREEGGVDSKERDADRSETERKRQRPERGTYQRGAHTW